MQKATEGLCHNPRVVGSGLIFFTNLLGERDFDSNPPTHYQFDPCTHEGACKNFTHKRFYTTEQKKTVTQKIQFTLSDEKMHQTSISTEDSSAQNTTYKTDDAQNSNSGGESHVNHTTDMTIHSTNKNNTDAENSTGNAKDQNSDNESRDKKNEGGSNDQSTDCSSDVVENSTDKNICCSANDKSTVDEATETNTGGPTNNTNCDTSREVTDNGSSQKSKDEQNGFGTKDTKILSVLILKIMGVHTKIPKKMKM